jgi:hypothetical protein
MCRRSIRYARERYRRADHRQRVVRSAMNGLRLLGGAGPEDLVGREEPDFRRI